LIQVFESHLGEISPDAFEEFILPSLKTIADHVKSSFPEIPLFIFPKGCHFCYKTLAQETKYDVISLDWTQSITEVRGQIEDDASLQGNIEPCILFAPDEKIVQTTHKMLSETKGTNFVANL
jgi:uroporphyrinogen decarboxylase